MSDLYFAADWVIRNVHFGIFDELRNVASELGGDFVVIQHSKTTQDDYVAAEFAIRIPLKEALDLFDERIAELAIRLHADQKSKDTLYLMNDQIFELTDWQTISKEEFERGTPSLFPDDPFLGVRVIDALIELAGANENRRNEQDQL
jgi:hypothetical protein